MFIITTIRRLTDPIILPDGANGESYLKLLQKTLPLLLEDLLLGIRLQLWFTHDGAPPHFSGIASDFLNVQFPNKFIGRGNDCPRSWPA